VGPDVCEADRFATGAFAMGEKGIRFIEERDGLEGYMIDKNGTATMTSGFSKYTVSFFRT
jgi:thiamine biosynthesis lipoprotein ApbE